MELTEENLPDYFLQWELEGDVETFDTWIESAFASLRYTPLSNKTKVELYNTICHGLQMYLGVANDNIKFNIVVDIEYGSCTIEPNDSLTALLFSKLIVL